MQCSIFFSNLFFGWAKQYWSLCARHWVPPDVTCKNNTPWKEWGESQLDLTIPSKQRGPRTWKQVTIEKGRSCPEDAGSRGKGDFPRRQTLEAEWGRGCLLLPGLQYSHDWWGLNNNVLILGSGERILERETSRLHVVESSLSLHGSCLSWGFYGWDETLWPKATWAGKGLFVLHLQITDRGD